MGVIDGAYATIVEYSDADCTQLSTVPNYLPAGCIVSDQITSVQVRVRCTLWNPLLDVVALLACFLHFMCLICLSQLSINGNVGMLTSFNTTTCSAPASFKNPSLLECAQRNSVVRRL